MKLVTNVAEVAARIRRYQSEIERSDELRKAIGRTSWWYAIKDGDRWMFAPASFVGAGAGVNALFANPQPNTTAFGELEEALSQFVASLGKKIGRRLEGFRIASDIAERVASPLRDDADDNVADRIVSDPGVCGGRPRIRGTRVRVVDIMQMLSSGMQAADIVADFPYIAEQDISAALAYSARAVDHAIVRAA